MQSVFPVYPGSSLVIPLLSPRLLRYESACIDAVNAAPAISTSVLGQCAHEHNDHFTDIHPSTNWRSQIEHAQKIGIGNMDYELVTVK